MLGNTQSNFADKNDSSICVDVFEHTFPASVASQGRTALTPSQQLNKQLNNQPIKNHGGVEKEPAS